MKTKLLFENKENGFNVIVNEIDKTKPMMVIFPGGGYEHLSIRESTPVSNRFIELGYNTTIVNYSVSPFADFIQLKQANMVLEKLSMEYENIIVMGFSAGGHLAGLVSTENKFDKIKCFVLCYPVISLEKYLHVGTKTNFLKGNDTIENQKKYSINNRVNENTPACFIWTTKDDQSVPYENTLLMINSLKENGITYESVIFPSGIHGISLADKTSLLDGDSKLLDEKIAKWPYLVDEFIKKLIN